MEALILVATSGGPTMFARIGIMRALNRNVKREFNSSRKDTHWGRRAIDEFPSPWGGFRARVSPAEFKVVAPRRLFISLCMQDDTPLIEAKKAKLIALGYPWPENLNDKSLEWLDAEIRETAPTPDPKTTG